MGCAIFENADGPNAAAINAIFTDGGEGLFFDLDNLDRADLDSILEELARLHVGANGNLAGLAA